MLDKVLKAIKDVPAKIASMDPVDILKGVGGLVLFVGAAGLTIAAGSPHPIAESPHGSEYDICDVEPVETQEEPKKEGGDE